MRANVYIDGFNLYYGAVRNTRYKWLDLEQLFILLRPHDNIQVINYFTARIMGSHAANQAAYLAALASRPKVNIIFGKYKLKTVLCRVADCTFDGRRTFQMPEEKRTDVLIALAMVQDAFQDRCDRLIVVSGDSDLVPAIRTVKNLTPEKEVVVYVPALDPRRGAAVELRSAADKDRILPNQLIRRSQFPATIPDGAGGVIHRPKGW